MRNPAVGGMPVGEPCPIGFCNGNGSLYHHPGERMPGALDHLIGKAPPTHVIPCPHVAIATAHEEAARLREQLVEAKAKLIAWRLFSTSLSAPDPHYEENVVEGIFRPYRDGRVHPQSEALRTQARRELGFPDPGDDGKVPAPPTPTPSAEHGAEAPDPLEAAEKERNDLAARLAWVTGCFTDWEDDTGWEAFFALDDPAAKACWYRRGQHEITARAKAPRPPPEGGEGRA